MQPNPPRPGGPQHGQPMAGGPAPWGGGSSPFAVPPRPKANAVAAVIAGVLALLAAGVLVWFAIYSGVYASEPGHQWTGLAVQNVLSGVIGAVALVIAAGFTFARRISGAWTLFALCVLYTVTTFVSPLLRGTTVSAQLKWVFGFGKINGVAIGLSIILCVLTAIMAAIAAGAKSSGPAAVPPRP